MEEKKKKSWKKRWQEARPSKTAVFWLLVAAVIVTVVVGFVWGGWTTGAAAQKLAQTSAREAVVARLASICTTQFDQDPGRELKLGELKKIGSYQRRAYVEDQGWATMPGDKQPDRGVAEECARLVLLRNP
jgi:hypothetical protein